MVIVNLIITMDPITEVGLIGIIVKEMKVEDLGHLATIILKDLIFEVLIAPLMVVLNHKEVDGLMKIMKRIGMELLKIHLPT